MKKYLVEFIGTFFLMLTIMLTVNGTAGNLAPLGIGFMLIAVIYAGAPTSGAHYNPAVTFGLWLRGKCDLADIPGYLIGQLAGAILAAFIGKFLVGHIPGATGIIMGESFDIISGGLAELLGTFVLVWVILHTGTAEATAGNSYYGIAIGFTVMGLAYSLGGVTGGAFNPAVAVGISIIGMTPWSNFAVFLISQFAAGALGAITFKYINGKN